MEKTKSRFLIVGIVVTLIVAVIGSSYAYWKGVIQGRGSDILVKLGQAEVILTDDMVLGDNKVRPGWSISKTFTVENQSGAVFKYDIYIRDLINTLVTDGFLQYKINSSDGGYNMEEFAPIAKSPTPSDFDLATNISIEASARHTYTIEFRYVDSPDVNQSEDMGKSFSGNLMIRENTSKTLYTILTDGVKYSDVKTRVTGDFDSALGGTSIDSSYDTIGVIYKETARKEDGKDVYYFAGNPQDNWVKFAGFYWRIIRTNEDGSVRLLYAGTSPDTQTGYINNTTYTYSINNSTYNNTMYVGWKYGTSGSLANNRGYSNQGAAKAALDSWYSTNITGSNANMVSTDAIYCNDRSGEAYNATGTMYYAAYSRLGRSSNRQPSYKCGEVTGTKYNNSSWVSGTLGSMYSDASNADKFSKTTGSGGNGQLAYPVGLMTADEVAFAGGKYGLKAPNTYYYRNSRTGCTGASGDPCSVTGTTWWWTMSPFQASGNGYAYLFRVGGSASPGALDYNYVRNTYAVRPVVSLKSSVLVSGGNGTATNPYTVE